MAKNLVNGNDTVIQENDNDISLELSNTYKNNLSQTINNSFKNNNVYSTTETVIGKWVDYKPIYRKVVDIGGLPNATTKTVSSGITNLSYITKMYGVANYGNYFIILNDVYPSDDRYGTRIEYNKETNNISISTAMDRSNYAGYVIIEYTKTTD